MAGRVERAQVEVSTPRGAARVLLVRSAHPRASLLLGHGAGGGIEAADLQLLAARLPARGIEVGLVEQPWRVAGRRVADRPEWLDEAWLEVVAALTRDGLLRGPLVVGGRSAGARVAARTASGCGAAGVVALAFPLHPPGRPEASRAAELAAAGRVLPVLVVQGGSDAFGAGAEVRAGLSPRLVARPAPPLPPAGVAVLDVPGADHSLRVRRSGPLAASEAADLVSATVGWWVRVVARRALSPAA